MKNLNNLIAGSLLSLTGFAFALFLMSFPNTGHSLELYNYKDNAKSTGIYTDKVVEQIWVSNQPACIKKGSRLLGVNKAFMKNDLKYADCSNSKANKRVHAALGFTVKVIKLDQLSTNMIKQVMKRK